MRQKEGGARNIYIWHEKRLENMFALIFNMLFIFSSSNIFCRFYLILLLYSLLDFYCNTFKLRFFIVWFHSYLAFELLFKKGHEILDTILILLTISFAIELCLINKIYSCMYKIKLLWREILIDITNLIKILFFV